MSEHLRLGVLLNGLIGAAAGGAAGYFAFGWIAQQGFYAMMLPGAALGLGCGWLSGQSSVECGLMSAVLALFLGIFTEWKFFPFVADDSFGYFVTHLHQLKPISLIMIALGGFFAFWFGIGRNTTHHADNNRADTESS